MNVCFVDTNVFIRYLTNDDPDKADRVENLLREAQMGKVRLVTAEVVMAELVWVLESSYRLRPSEIAPLVRAILATPGLDVLNGALVAAALQLYESKGIGFIDGYIAAVMQDQKISALFTFDAKHIDRLDFVNRKEP